MVRWRGGGRATVCGGSSVVGQGLFLVADRWPGGARLDVVVGAVAAAEELAARHLAELLFAEDQARAVESREAVHFRQLERLAGRERVRRAYLHAEIES